MRNLLSSLRARILLLFGVASLIFIAVMGFHATAERQMRLKFVNEQLQDTAKVIAAQNYRAIDDAEHVLESLSDAQTTRATILPESCQHTLAQRLREEPRIANIILALPDGNVVCSANPIDRPINIAARPYFQLALTSPGVVIGEVNASPITGKRRLPFIKAIRDANGRTLGVIVVTLDLSRLVTEVANGKYPSDATLGLIDARGQVLAGHADAEGWVGKNASSTSFFKAVAAHGGKGSFEEIGIDGVPRVYGLARFAETAAGPISLWLGVDKKAVTADIDRDFAWTAFAVAAVLLVTFATMWAGGERLVMRPLSALSAAAHRIGQGDLSARTGLEHARDELGKLAQSLDEMASSLGARGHHVVLANRAVTVLSKWHRAPLTPRDEYSLIECMCRAIVEEGRYCGAWVSFSSPEENSSAESAAWWGLESKLVASLDIVWADALRGRRPASTSIRHGTVAIVDDNLTNPDAVRVRENVLHQQHRAVMSVPLRMDDAVIGALTILAGESESFGEEEEVQFTEVAAALSCGIAAVRACAARKRLELTLQDSEERFRAAADANMDALLVLKSVHDAAGNLVDFEVTDVNGRARELALAKGGVIGRTLFQLFPMYRFRTAGLFSRYAQVVATRTPLEEELAINALRARRMRFRQRVVAVENGVAVSLRRITA